MNGMQGKSNMDMKTRNLFVSGKDGEDINMEKRLLLSGKYENVFDFKSLNERLGWLGIKKLITYISIYIYTHTHKYYSKTWLIV